MTQLKGFRNEIIDYHSGKVYGTMLVEIEKCPICKKFMVSPPGKYNDTFPKWNKITFTAQLQAAGWEAVSEITVDNEYICQKCAGEGRADFLCYLCQDRKPTDKIQNEFGDPPEFLCVDCYNTVTAKEWNDASNKLHHKHRWDYE